MTVEKSTVPDTLGGSGQAANHAAPRRATVILNAFATRAGGPVGRLREVTRRAGEAWGAGIVVVHNPEIAPEPGVPAVTLPGPLRKLPAWPRRLLEPWLLRRAVQRFNADAVIHYGSYVPLRRSRRFSNILYFVNLAPWDPGVGSRTVRNRALRYLFARTARHADVIVVQSEATGAFLRARYPDLGLHIATVRNGCSIPQLVRPADARDFVAVGHVYRYRRVERIVRAYAALPADVRAAHHLVVIGHLERDREAVRLVRSEIDRAGIAESVRLVGALPREAVLQRLITACAFVSFSAVDNGPNALQEAAALGVPLVLSDIPVYHELARGWTEFAGDDATLTRALLSAAANAQAGAAQARGPVETWDQHVTELGDVLRELGVIAT